MSSLRNKCTVVVGGHKNTQSPQHYTSCSCPRGHLFQSAVFMHRRGYYLCNRTVWPNFLATSTYRSSHLGHTAYSFTYKLEAMTWPVS